MSAEPVTDDELAEIELYVEEKAAGIHSKDDAVRRAHMSARMRENGPKLLPKLAAEVRANRRSLDVANATIKRLAAEADELRAKAKAFDLLRADYEAAKDGRLSCGHTVADLIGGTETAPDGSQRPCVTKCGECLALRQGEALTRAVDAAKKMNAIERDRVRRLFDHHLTGRVVDDDVRAQLEAFIRDVAAGTDRRPA